LGRFITDSVFRAERTNDLATVFQTRLVGLVVRHHPLGGLKFTTAACDFVEVYLDDVLVWPDASVQGGIDRKGNGSDFPLISPSELVGAEFYRNYSAPARYRPAGRGCAVLLLWRSAP
jgi:hypothetical protein